MQSQKTSTTASSMYNQHKGAKFHHTFDLRSLGSETAHWLPHLIGENVSLDCRILGERITILI